MGGGGGGEGDDARRGAAGVRALVRRGEGDHTGSPVRTKGGRVSAGLRGMYGRSFLRACGARVFVVN